MESLEEGVGRILQNFQRLLDRADADSLPKTIRDPDSEGNP